MTTSEIVLWAVVVFCLIGLVFVVYTSLEVWRIEREEKWAERRRRRLSHKVTSKRNSSEK
jgi:hypothetical protein